MALKHHVLLLGAVVLLSACHDRGVRSRSECLGSLETSAAVTTVQTKSGPVSGYIDGGVFIYKGIPYASAERFMPAVDPEPWTDVRSSRAYGPTCPQGARAGWYDDNQAFAMHWDDGFPDEDCLRVNIWTI